MVSGQERRHRKIIGGHRNGNDMMDVRSYKSCELKNRGDNKSGGSRGKEVELVWACDADRGALCREEGDVIGNTKKEEKRKADGCTV